ncbi:hypothetical protein [Phycisphaera mikurensis]|uniref:Uncharacterized protein n=1 Tax=Phycisphaera mikurensis (strain NBRC 102666 / KCTC 22515 / FYK2301M01) TaxID=1142394 RepID=I0II06_PHYMF|nr:hypothetical protein [Phycisphaera mikurensis]MBB6442542.1 hypothetical protein [Phycisphaera mikurensis]BAM04894.1 hypothetical protein PSMK_27350 [Phycisphaera mikurensis NBRC 102666]
MTPSPSDVADAIEAGLLADAAALDAEQAVAGLDVLREIDLHPFLHSALRAADARWGVWPEQKLPGGWSRRKRSEGERCDVVLTPGGRPVLDGELAGTLFGDPGGAGVAPEEAFWLEVKTTAQFGEEGFAKRYAAELGRTLLADARKLARDRGVRHAGLLLVLFTADEETAVHDAGVWHEKALSAGLMVELPSVRGFPLTDRVGNRWCGIFVFGIRPAT